MGRIVYSPEHQKFKPGQLYDPRTEKTFAHPDVPERVEAILSRLEELSWPVIRETGDYKLDRYFALHDFEMIELFREVDQAISRGALAGAVVPREFVGRIGGRRPISLEGRLGWYCTDVRTPIVAGTWAAACGSLSAAVAGAELVLGGESPVYALCRPGGHHAGRDFFGGGCYLNNAAAAAARFLRKRRVAIVDIGYQHGNGTQDIFYGSREVLFVSVHADPAVVYPYYSGYGTERGEARGRGQTHNIVLPVPSTAGDYTSAVEKAMRLVRGARAQALVLSFGADIARSEQVAGLGMSLESIRESGRIVARAGIPVLVVQEDGSDLATIGAAVENLLRGLEEK